MGELRVAVHASGAQSSAEALGEAVLAGRLGRVLLVDCSNRFNPYAVLKLCKDRVEAEHVLENILLSRPFTIYQLENLLENELVKSVRELGAKRVIVSGFTELFEDEDVKEEERNKVFRGIVQRLQYIPKQTGFSLSVHVPQNEYSLALQEACDG